MSGALADFLQECEAEEGRRCEPEELGEGASLEAPSAAEALIALVRREVRTAVDQELAALREGRRQGQEHCESEALCSERVAPSTAASSCGSPSPHPQRFFEKLAAEMLTAQREVFTRTLEEASSERLREAEAQLEALKSGLGRLDEGLSRQVEQWDSAWKSEAELRAEGDQEVEASTVALVSGRLEALEAQLGQVSASVGSLARLQVELGAEAKLRQEADGRLQVFLRDFRGHVVSEIEEIWANHRQLGASVEGVRGLVSKVVELVELHGREGGSVLQDGVCGVPALQGLTEDTLSNEARSPPPPSAS